MIPVLFYIYDGAAQPVVKSEPGRIPRLQS